MSIRKNKIPILEFDDNPIAVINPTHEELKIALPSKCVYAFVGDYIDLYAQKCCVGYDSLYGRYTCEYRAI